MRSTCLAAGAADEELWLEGVLFARYTGGEEREARALPPAVAGEDDGGPPDLLREGLAKEEVGWGLAETAAGA